MPGPDTAQNCRHLQERIRRLSTTCGSRPSAITCRKPNVGWPASGRPPGHLALSRNGLSAIRSVEATCDTRTKQEFNHDDCSFPGASWPLRMRSEKQQPTPTVRNSSSPTERDSRSKYKHCDRLWAFRLRYLTEVHNAPGFDCYAERHRIHRLSEYGRRQGWFES